MRATVDLLDEDQPEDREADARPVFASPVEAQDEALRERDRRHEQRACPHRRPARHGPRWRTGEQRSCECEPQAVPQRIRDVDGGERYDRPHLSEPDACERPSRRSDHYGKQQRSGSAALPAECHARGQRQVADGGDAVAPERGERERLAAHGSLRALRRLRTRAPGRPLQANVGHRRAQAERRPAASVDAWLAGGEPAMRILFRM
jgi:hypothetical protein